MYDHPSGVFPLVVSSCLIVLNSRAFVTPSFTPRTSCSLHRRKGSTVAIGLSKNVDSRRTMRSKRSGTASSYRRGPRRQALPSKAWTLGLRACNRRVEWTSPKRPPIPNSKHDHNNHFVSLRSVVVNQGTHRRQTIKCLRPPRPLPQQPSRKIEPLLRLDQLLLQPVHRALELLDARLQLIGLPRPRGPTRVRDLDDRAAHDRGERNERDDDESEIRIHGSILRNKKKASSLELALRRVHPPRGRESGV